MSAPAIVSMAEATFQYPNGSKVIGPFDCAVRQGEFHLITGGSGCGKSTLARMMSGVIPHLYRGDLDGNVLIDGQPSRNIPLWALSRRVGLVAQNPAAQILTSTVVGDVRFGLDNLGLPVRDVERRLSAALSDFGLDALADRDPRTLSGGEQQKLALAAPLARQPEAIVLDEPLSMIDSAAAQHIVARLDRLRRAGTAVVVFEHRRKAFAQIDDLTRTHLRGGNVSDHPLPELRKTISVFRFVADAVGVDLGGQPVLQGIDLTFAGAQIVSIVGANGAGKTTLLRAFAGLQPHRGRITIYRSGLGRGRLGLCFQNADRQIFNATVRDEILFGLSGYDTRFYREVVDLLGLAPYEATPPLLLSEGEKKRLALAIALLRPDLCGICLDEPTLGQDDACRHQLGAILRRLAAAGYLCVVATHDLEWALQWSDQIAVLGHGRVLATGAPQVLLSDSNVWARANLLPPESVAPPCRVEVH